MNLFKSKPEYYLENAVSLNKQYPRSFLIPSQAEIDKLKIGSTVKLIFVMNRPQKDGCRAERMWVSIVDIENGRYIGQLDNTPYYLKTIAEGDKIEFLAQNIAAIKYPAADLGFDEKKFAIITKRALDKRQINWLTRTDELIDEQDSGWQFFYGGEDSAYLDNADNCKIVLLEDALSFEPLLEKVFAEKGNAYEYDKKSNTFIEAKD